MDLFPREKGVKFHFSFSKPRKRPFCWKCNGKCKISQSRGDKAFPCRRHCFQG